MPGHVVISEFITNLTGITKNMCDNGTKCVDAMKIFIEWFLKCDTVVAHNIDFDRNMIRLEIARHHAILSQDIPFIDIIFNSLYDRIVNVHQYDTMIRTNKTCNILVPKKDGSGMKLKLPKLIELYQILFHQIPQNLHNSLIDVLVTMRCFIKFRYHRDISDDYFNKLMDNTINQIPSALTGHLVEW